MKHNKYKILFGIIVLFYSLILSQFGFENFDTGYMSSFSWRIVNGQNPYSDFIYKFPPVVIYFHSFFMKILPETGQFFMFRILSYLFFALQVFFTVSGFDNIYGLKNYKINKWAINKHGQIDDYQYGGGAGMVIMCEPLINAIEELQQTNQFDEIIYMTPDGKNFNQQTANRLSLKENILIICGHYKGIDQRIRDHYITMEISIGDYVLSGGELAAAVVVDAIGRLIPGVLNDETSALTDSFQDNLLAPPVYTRPADFRGWKVPDILLTGDPKKVEDWRMDQSLQRTQEKRPDLLD
jgi:tRNA (guanine37-N1)-methyltransferase